MAWIIGIFAAVLVVAVVIYAAGWIRSLLTKQQTARAELRQRSREGFPVTIVFFHRYRTEYYLTFRLSETGKDLKLKVGQDVYDQYRTGMTGRLTWKGKWFLIFLPDYNFEASHTRQEAERPEELQKSKHEAGDSREEAEQPEKPGRAE